jgi:hypothetical protein
MQVTVDDITNDPVRYRLLAKVGFSGLAEFILSLLARRSAVNFVFWTICLITLSSAVYIRISLGGYPRSELNLHFFLGGVALVLLSIPVHELLHVIPYYLSGARDIRAGMDLSQYLFYVTAHRYVTGAVQFACVAVAPFLIITIACVILILAMPGAWQWSISLFLFLHTTMCAGDFALLSFLWTNRKKKIMIWDDAEEKIAYFYEEAKGEEVKG